MSTDRLVMVSGTSRGLGKQLAAHYLGRGFRVVGMSRTAPESCPPGYRHFTLDITEEAQVLEMFEAVRRDYGRLDILVNNAGAAMYNHCLLTPISTVRRMFEVNALAPFLLSRESAKLMSKGKAGRIVNITSLAVPLAVEGEAAYAASKAALESMTRVMARELAPMQITCNALGLTPMRTEMLDLFPPDKIQALLARQCLARMAEPEDVMHTMDYFIDERAGMVTGQTIYLGGVF